MNVVTVVPFTTRKPGRTIYPNEVLVPLGTAGLDAESILLCHQIRAEDMRRFSTIYGLLSDAFLQSEIEEALKFHFGIK